MPFRIHFEWAETAPKQHFRTGVSLHSHTLHSREKLDFIYRMAAKIPLVAATVRAGEKRYQQFHRGARLDLSRAWWTPPLGALDAWQLEKSQIEGAGLGALVSITDHDDIEAPMSLRLLEPCQASPVSVEWTVPFRGTFFHLGIHNLPPSTARQTFERMQLFRGQPDEPSLYEILAGITADKQSLVVFNHPLWDEPGIGQKRHDELAHRFLLLAKGNLHALEINGMRPWRENRRVISFAGSVGKPLISGGDRHAIEPNTLLNLTNASTFAEFVEEVRAGRSEVLIMRQYREPYSLRLLHNLVDVLKTYDQHVQGWRLWSDRVFYSCEDGQPRSLSELWPTRTSAPVAWFVGAVQLMSQSHIRRFLRGAFPRTEEFSL